MWVLLPAVWQASQPNSHGFCFLVVKWGKIEALGYEAIKDFADVGGRGAGHSLRVVGLGKVEDGIC